jgi:hypothetical protein
MVSLASLAGEKMFFAGDSSSGVSGDLESATQLAILMEGYWGMGSSIASHGVTHRVGIGGGGQPGAGDDKERQLLKTTLGGRIDGKLEELFVRTEALIGENRLEVLAVTHALETHKTLTGEDIEAVIEGRPGPLVDGTGYHTAEFATQAELYHEQVVVAHSEHGRVAVPLPSLNGHGKPTATVPAIAAAPEVGWGAAGTGDGVIDLIEPVPWNAPFGSSKNGAAKNGAAKKAVKKSGAKKAGAKKEER